MDPINYEELAKEVIKQQQKSPEQIPQSHKEAVVSILKEKMSAQQPVVPQPTYQQPKPLQPNIVSTDPDLPTYAASAPEESKQEVRNLIEFTLSKGLSQGIAQAAKSDPFVIDMYHDALAEHIVTQMKEKGMI